MPDAARVLSRIILKLNNGGEYEKGYYTDKCYRQFKDLMTRKYFPKIFEKGWQGEKNTFLNIYGADSILASS